MACRRRVSFRGEHESVSCHGFRNNEVRLQLHALAYNLGNFMRTLALPEAVEHWSLTTLQGKLIKIGTKVVRHGRYITFQLAEVAHRVPALGSENRVDEGGDRAALRQHDEAAEHKHHDEYRKQPEFLPFPHECPKLHQESHQWPQN